MHEVHEDPRLLAKTSELAVTGAEFMALRQQLPADIFSMVSAVVRQRQPSPAP